MSDVAVLDLATQQMSRVRGLPLAEQQREKPALWERSQEIWDAAVAENRPMNANEDARYTELTALVADINAREEQAARNERLRAQNLLPRRDGRLLPGSHEPGSLDNETGEYRSAVLNYIRAFRSAELGPDTWQTLRRGERKLGESEQRALSTTIGTAGGYLIPTQFEANIIQTMLAYSPVESLVDVLTTSGGQDIEWPTNDDTGNVGAEVAENTDVSTATDPTFGSKTLRSYLYTSRVFLVPFSLLQDSAVDIEAYIAARAAERIGRIAGRRFVLGTGVNQIEGITIAGTVGKTAASATAVTYNELIDLEHSVDPAYRNERCRYLFRDATFAALRKLADSQNRPLWVPWLGAGIADAPPATFNGWRYQVVQDMPSMATGNKSIAFGDFNSGYKFRRVNGFSLVRIEERYVEKGQVGFLLFARMDGRVVDTSAFKLLAQA